jgi:hypothetical protein
MFKKSKLQQKIYFQFKFEETKIRHMIDQQIVQNTIQILIF